MKDLLLFVGAIAGGLGIGVGVTVILRAVTGNDNLATTVGAGVWILSVMLILVYGSLAFSEPEEIADPPRPKTTIQRWHATKAENKLRAAELRCGFVFAVIGGVIAAMANGSNVVITIVTICCAAIGGLVGFDIKRRVRRIRERFNAHDVPDGD